MSGASALQRIALAAYFALLLLGLLWEAWLAPSAYAPPAFWALVKTAPMLLPLPGLLRARPRAHLFASLLVLVYFAEGVVLAWSERHHGLQPGSALPYAWLEVALSLAFIVAAAWYVRVSGGAHARR